MKMWLVADYADLHKTIGRYSEQSHEAFGGLLQAIVKGLIRVRDINRFMKALLKTLQKCTVIISEDS